jgi:hypothetical protein
MLDKAAVEGQVTAEEAVSVIGEVVSSSLLVSRRLRILTQQLATELARHGGALDSGKPLSKTHYETGNAARLSHSRGA